MSETPERLTTLRTQWIGSDSLGAATAYINGLEYELAAAQASNDELREDAERYRWLREARLDADHNQISMVTIHGVEEAFEDLDEAIDAMRKETT